MANGHSCNRTSLYSTCTYTISYSNVKRKFIIIELISTKISNYAFYNSTNFGLMCDIYYDDCTPY